MEGRTCCVAVGLSLAWLTLLAGCGVQQRHVEGSVLLDGQPVADGGISFEPADGLGCDFGAKIVNGIYRASAPPQIEPGRLIVRIRAMRKTGRRIPAGPPHPPGTLVDEFVGVPARYNDRSVLSASLERAPITTANFELRSVAAQP